MVDRFEGLIPIGSHVWTVLPDDEGRPFLCPVVYSGYTLEHTLFGKEYVHHVIEVDLDGSFSDEEEEVVDPELIRWSKHEAIDIFHRTYPDKVVYGVVFNPDDAVPETVS